MYGGKTCPGKPVETKECNVEPCPPPKSKYTNVILQATVLHMYSLNNSLTDDPLEPQDLKLFLIQILQSFR